MTTTEETIHEYQSRIFKNAVAVGLGMAEEDMIFSTARGHRSKSRELPILEAGSLDGSPVYVQNLSYNFYFYFLAVRLKQGIPATFLRPISDYFGRIALSGHVQEPEWMITNFEKAYQNVERVDRLAMMLGNPFQVAVVLRYLKTLTELPLGDILDDVLYKTRYGNIDAIDFNAVGNSQEVAEKAGLVLEDRHAWDVVVQELNPLYESMEIDVFDTSNGRSSVHLTTCEPLLPVSAGAEILVPVSDKIHELGIGTVSSKFGREKSRIPVKYLHSANSMNDPEWPDKYQQRHRLHRLYMRDIPLSLRTFTLNYSNPLDSIMGAVLLNNCLTRRVVNVLEAEQ